MKLVTVSVVRTHGLQSLKLLMLSMMLSMHLSSSLSQATRDIFLLSTFRDQWIVERLVVFQVYLHARLVQLWRLSQLRPSQDGRWLDSPLVVVVGVETSMVSTTVAKNSPSLISARNNDLQVLVSRSLVFRLEVPTVLFR